MANANTPLSVQEILPRKPSYLSRVVERKLDHDRKVAIIYGAVIGDVAAYNCEIVGNIFFMMKSVAIVTNEVSGYDFRSLAILFATVFSMFFGVLGVKMCIDGKREFFQWWRKRDAPGMIMAMVRIVEGSIMVCFGTISFVITALFIKHLFDPKSPFTAERSLLLSLSKVTLGAYVVVEGIGALREYIKHKELKEELEKKLGYDPRAPNYEEAFSYLRDSVLVTWEEEAEIKNRVSSYEEYEDERENLRLAKEGVFSFFYGTDLMESIKELARELDFATFSTAGFRGGTFQAGFNFEGRVNLTLPSKLNSGWEVLSRKTDSKKLQSRGEESIDQFHVKEYHSLSRLERLKQQVSALFFGEELYGKPKTVQQVVEMARAWNRKRIKTTIVYFSLITLFIATGIVCFLVFGEIPIIAGAVIMGLVSLTLNIMNARRICIFWKSKEIGKLDEVILAIGMVFVIVTLATAIILSGGGPIVIAIFGATGALILLIKGISWYKLRILRKEREAKAVSLREREMGIELYEISTLQP